MYIHCINKSKLTYFFPIHNVSILCFLQLFKVRKRLKSIIVGRFFPLDVSTSDEIINTALVFFNWKGRIHFK